MKRNFIMGTVGFLIVDTLQDRHIYMIKGNYFTPIRTWLQQKYPYQKPVFDNIIELTKRRATPPLPSGPYRKSAEF